MPTPHDTALAEKRPVPSWCGALASTRPTRSSEPPVAGRAQLPEHATMNYSANSPRSHNP